MHATLPAVLFDLDGTLVDSEPNYFEAGRRLFSGHGIDRYTWDRHADFVGIGTRETLEALREEYGLDVPVDRLLAVKNAHYLELAGRATEVFPQMRELVGLLHTAGHPMAVASGSSRAAIEAVLAATGLDALIPVSVSVSAEEVPRGKPQPDVFLEAAARLGVRPEDCVVLEDAEPGAEAAHRAGMRCVAVPYLPERAGADAFATAGLVFAGGPGEFTARAAYDYIVG